MNVVFFKAHFLKLSHDSFIKFSYSTIDRDIAFCKFFPSNGF